MNGNGSGKEMVMQIYSDYPALVDLMKLREDSRLPSATEDQIMILEQGIQYLVIYRCLLSLVNREKSHVDAALKREGILNIGVLALDTGEFNGWDTLASDLLTEINSYKPSIREDCSIFCEGVYIENFLIADFFPKFMRYTDISMSNVLQLKGDKMNPDEKMKFESFKEKLDMLRTVFEYVKESNTTYQDFSYALTSWVCNAAYLCLFYWVQDENMASDEKNVTLFKFYDNFYFSHPKDTEACLNFLKNNSIPVEERCKVVGDVVSPDITKMCLSYLNATNPSVDKRHEAFSVVSRFTESLHHNLRVYLPKEAIEILHEAMTFLIAFMIDPPSAETNVGQLVLTKTQQALKEATTLMISLDHGEKDEASIFETTNFLLHDYIEMVITIKVEVRKVFSHLFLDLSFKFPRLNVLNLFDSSIENLKESPSRSSNQLILTIEKEIVVFRDLLKASNLKDNFMLELQNEHIGLQDLWNRIANVAHQVDRIIRSNTCHNGLGLDIFFLQYLKDEIKCLLPKVKRIKYKHVQDSYTSKMNLNPIIPLKLDHVPEVDEVIVGLEGKAKEIREWLIHGSKNLDIISIIGMAGLGKTTLAKKVYNDPLVKRHFPTCAWCTVSQSYDIKKLLLEILKDVIEVNDNFNEMEEEDLSDKLRKILKGKRYLIVMDDIWDVGAWNRLKSSFPDDEKYSRILFTSRIHNVVLDAKSDSFPYFLNQLSNEESWELLERRLFNDIGICPRNFLPRGKQIAKDCKGLPLAVVLVAGLLKKEIDNLDWWKQVGESLDSRISKEGCAHILELSYKHLPESLQVCFLYLGLFQEDKVIQVQKLINLWVSEGFIQEKEMKDVEIVAKEYVMDLIGRSLLIVSSKSSNGGIKTCHIHDLLREFCMEKSKEEHFFKLLHGKNVSRHSMDEYYRVSIQSEYWEHFHVKISSPLYSIRICPTGTSNEINISQNSFCNARFLQVLDLEEAKFDGDFPEEITTLIFLRYLAIWCTTRFIPATIARLEKLETLRIIRKETFFLRPEILLIENLRHVHIGKFFPHIFYGAIPPMKNIRSFSTPCLAYGKEVEDFLSKLRTIQKLKCRFGSYQQNKMVKLDFLNQLESLNLTHDGSPMLRSFIFSLPQNIKKLTLSNFGLPWSEISKIVELPNLEVLKLLADAFMGKFWNMEDDEEFKRLKFLKLQGLNVQKWSASYENFPSLEQIVVEQCHKLEEIPTEFVEISTLRNIQIRRCRSSVVNSAKEIEVQQIDLGSLNFKMQAVQILKEKLYGSDYGTKNRY